MLKSLAAKLSGLGAAGVVACTLAAHPASASLIPNNPCRSGWTVSQSGTSIVGSCFIPGSVVTMHFDGAEGGEISNYQISFPTASIFGTVSVPIIWAFPCQTELVYAEDGPFDIASNDLTLTCPRVYLPAP